MAGLEVCQHRPGRFRRDEAQIRRTRSGNGCLGLELAALLVQVDLLAPESQGSATTTERHDLHAENARVEVARGGDVPDREDKMIDSVYLHVVWIELAIGVWRQGQAVA